MMSSLTCLSLDKNSILLRNRFHHPKHHQKWKTKTTNEISNQAMKKQTASNTQTTQIRWPIRKQRSNLGSNGGRGRKKLKWWRRNHQRSKRRCQRRNMSGSSKNQCYRNFRLVLLFAGCICLPLWCSLYSCFYVQAQTQLKHSTYTEMRKR